MSSKRRSYEAGHKPKFLVVIDDSPECDRAVYYASRRCARIGASVVMCRVIETKDHSQQWLGVADIMRAEAQEEARAVLAKAAARANGVAGIAPGAGDSRRRQGAGNPRPDRGGRGHRHAGAGGRHRQGRSGSAGRPTSAKTAGTFPIPVAIVPGHLSDEELDAMS